MLPATVCILGFMCFQRHLKRNLAASSLFNGTSQQCWSRQYLRESTSYFLREISMLQKASCAKSFRTQFSPGSQSGCSGRCQPAGGGASSYSLQQLRAMSGARAPLQEGNHGDPCRALRREWTSSWA